MSAVASLSNDECSLNLYVDGYEKKAGNRYTEWLKARLAFRSGECSIEILGSIEPENVLSFLDVLNRCGPLEQAEFLTMEQWCRIAVTRRAEGFLVEVSATDQVSGHSYNFRATFMLTTEQRNTAVEQFEGLARKYPRRIARHTSDRP